MGRRGGFHNLGREPPDCEPLDLIEGGLSRMIMSFIMLKLSHWTDTPEPQYAGTW